MKFQMLLIVENILQERVNYVQGQWMVTLLKTGVMGTVNGMDQVNVVRKCWLEVFYKNFEDDIIIYSNRSFLRPPFKIYYHYPYPESFLPEFSH